MKHASHHVNSQKQWYWINSSFQAKAFAKERLAKDCPDMSEQEMEEYHEKKLFCRLCYSQLYTGKEPWTAEEKEEYYQGV